MTEWFQTFNEASEPLALKLRERVHIDGDWHKAAQVFVFDFSGRLLIQQRSADKDLFPLRWDSSVGEHLKPDETYAEGARRGLMEELGIEGVALTALGDELRYVYKDDRFWDREMQTAFACRFEGEIRPCQVEVAAVRWIPWEELTAKVDDEPDAFTPWFHRHFQTYPLREWANSA